jgi:serine protease AprX
MRVLVGALTLGAGGALVGAGVAPSGPSSKYIVEGSTSSSAAASVASVGGHVFASLPIVHGVAADLTAAEAGVLQHSGLQVTADLPVTVEGAAAPQLSDTAGADTALPSGGLSYTSSGPFAHATQAITTDGSTGWAETTTGYDNPENLTILVRFKTTTSGAILGFSNSQNPVSSGPSNYDRMLWVDSSGKLVWGVYNNACDEITSSSTVNTGSWIFAAVEIGSSGQQMYVNGSLVASSSNTSAQNYRGWWSIAYANAGPWSDAPSSDYFNGSLAQLAIVPSQLSSSQVSTLSSDSTFPSYTSAVVALGPTNYWPLNDAGEVPYSGPTSLADASGNADTASVEGGVTLGAAGPLGGSAISLNGSTGWAETTNPYANPEGFSVVGWFETSTTSGGSIIGFSNNQANGSQSEWDRQLWIDNSGKVVWGVYPGSTQEVTSPAAYNNGAWHMVVAEIGSAGQQLWVDGTEVASNSSVTSAQSYTGFWHIGYGNGESNWPDPPSSAYLAGSLSQLGIVPTQLSASQISTLYDAASASAFANDMGQLSPTSYWGLQDSGAASTAYTSETGATSLWADGINGSGETVAVLDTGIDASLPDLSNTVVGGVDLSGTGQGWNTDQYGHGTFVAGLIASSGESSDGQYMGVAPGASLVSIKVAGSSGVTTESTVIQGVAWAVSNESSLGIRVLNMSLGVEPASASALDPLDQAVEQAWKAGIVVVTSAGNNGPDNGTITSPGDDPLVITVGAIADNGLDVPANFTVPAFSSVGPTMLDAWFKPDLVAPGRSVVSLMAPNSTTYTANPLARIGSDNFIGSGTSFSAAIVSGLVALLLEDDPSLTPNQVKAALLLTAAKGPVGDPFVDGHGIATVSAAASVAGQVTLNQAVAATAESDSPPVTVSLSSTWAASTWNPANWSGAAWNSAGVAALAASAPITSVTGLAWTGATWNDAAWNDAAWNDAAWNDAAWNDAAWNDAAWNDAAWNDAAWNDAAWNDAAWNAYAWG